MIFRKIRLNKAFNLCYQNTCSIIKLMNITEHKKWYKLDNAAKLYPAIKSKRWTAVYRVSIKLFRPVDKDLLQEALDITTDRMSVFSCRLKAGLFWYYFEKNKKRAMVKIGRAHV